MNNDNKMRPPPDKKRRTDGQHYQTTADQMWDDECEDFTEDQWDNIDVLVASQQGSSSTTGQYGIAKSKPDEGCSKKAQPTSSSLHSSSKLIGRGTQKSKSSNDVRTNSAVASSQDQTVEMKNYQTGFSDKMQQENMHLKCRECRHLSKQIEKYRNAHYSTDGRLKILQENVAQKDAELMRIKQERAAVRDQQARETTNKEKELNTENNKLRTQLQFKEQEIKEIQQQCKHKDNLLTKLPDHQAEGKAAQGKLAKAALKASPNGRTSASTNSTNTFPTTQRFLVADETSPKSVQKKLFNEKTTQAHARPERSPKERLMLRNPRGQRTGQQLVLKLLHAHVGTSETGSKPMTSPVCRGSESDDAGSSPDTHTLSPMSSLLTASDSSLDEKWIQRQCTNISGLTDQVIILLRTVQSLLQVPFVGQPVTELLNTHDHNATALLPVINGIISECLTSVDTVLAEDVTSSIPMSSPSLGSSTTDTLTVSDVSPRHSERTGSSNGTALSNKLANLLRLLLCLVESSAQVREALLAELITTSQLNHTVMETVSSPNRVTGEEAAARRSLGQSATDFVLHKSVLHKLCCLVSQAGQHICFATSSVCAYAMNILAVVLEGARPNQIQQLNVFCLRDAMMSCVTSTEYSNVDTLAVGLAILRVLQSLMRDANTVTCLCSHTGSTDCQPPTNECLLDAVYNMCFQASLDLPISQRSVLQNRLCSTISTAISCRKFGLNLLVNLEKDCPCNEVVKLLVCRLHDTWQSVLHTNHAYDVDFLRMATSLIQMMSTMDRDYVEHREDVEPTYVDFVCGLEQLFKNQLSLLHPVEKSVCNNLCDFKQDLPMDEDEQEESQETSQDPPSHQQIAHSVPKTQDKLHLGSDDQPAGPPVCSRVNEPSVSSHELKRSLNTAREPGKLSRRKLSTTAQRQHTNREQPMDVVNID